MPPNNNPPRSGAPGGAGNGNGGGRQSDPNAGAGFRLRRSGSASSGLSDWVGSLRDRVAMYWRRRPGTVRTAMLIVVGLAAFGLGFMTAAWSLVCDAGRCPSIDVLDSYQPRQTSKLYAADGSFIAELGLERRTLLTLNDIPKTVRDAFVTTEDKRFFSHHGIDWVRVAGAAGRNLASRGYAQGFSTITMQLARNLFPETLTREKTLIRKLKEAKVARAIEAKYSKDRILELYLNQIYLGNGAYGVETASQQYFGKSARDLNLAEAATLAALPKGPERYNPRRYPERAVTRRNTVIELMRHAAVVTDSEASLARAYPLDLTHKGQAGSGGGGGGEQAPYFVEWVRQQLDAQFGRQLYEQGLKVYTTLDPGSAERGGAVARATAARDRGRQVREVSAPDVRGISREERVRGWRSERRGDVAVSAGMFHRARSAYGRGTGAGGRARLRRLEVQPRDAGTPPAGIDIQADRVRQCDPERPAAVVHGR